MLYKQGENWFIAETSKAPEAGKGKLKTEDMEVSVEPREEWNQMYHEVWRIERDFFYDPHYHGLNLPAAEKEFTAFSAGRRKPRGPQLPVSRNAQLHVGRVTCSCVAGTSRKLLT